MSGKPLVGVILGSRADFNIMRRGLESLRVMGVPYMFELASPHKTPDRVISFAQNAGEIGIEVIICAAGGAAQIAGMLACYTTLPIIAVPIDSTPLRGQDALHSMVQQPPGIPVATVGINAADNAALLATQILALKYPRFRTVLAHARYNLTQRLESSQKELLSVYPDLCDPGRTAPPHLSTNKADAETDPGSDTDENDTFDTPDRRNDEIIRPGAILVHRPAGSALPPLASAAGRLVRTPTPQEPGTVTDDPETATPAFPTIGEDQDFPPPPDNTDFTPLPLTMESFPSFDNFGGFNRDPVRGPEPSDQGEAAFITDTPTPPGMPAEKRAEKRSETALKSMHTKVFQLDPADPDEDVLSHAMMVILEGGIVAFPTDTVYGLAVDATDPEAVRRLYEVKGRDAQFKSLSVLISSADMLDNLVREVPPPVEAVLDEFWPGGLTVLFPKHPSILNTVSDSPSIAIRIPNNPIPMNLMKMVDRPLAVINAALRDAEAATNARQVIERFQGKVDCILDAGACMNAEASTVLSVITEPYEILREGAVPAEALRSILGDKMRG